MYLSDLFTTFVNLARIPSLSVPCGYTHSKEQNRTDSESMPIGIQFAGPLFSEAKILSIAQVWEEEHKGCGFPLGLTE